MRINIREILNQYNQTAFVCSNFEDIQTLLDQLKSEGIRRIFYAYQEDWDVRFEEYTRHLDVGHKSVIIIKLEKSGYDIYSRSYKDWGQYKDWDKYHFINYSAYIREDKLNQLL